MTAAARAGAEEDVRRRVPDVGSLMAALDRTNYLACLLYTSPSPRDS